MAEDACAICCAPRPRDAMMYYFRLDSAVPPPCDAPDWVAFPYCADCVGLLRETQVAQYFARLRTCDCRRELLALLADGPPEFVRDRQVFAEHPRGEPRWHRIGPTRVAEARVTDTASDDDRALLARYRAADEECFFADGSD